MRSRPEQSDGGAPGARQRAAGPVPPAPHALTSAGLLSLQRLADPGVVARDAGPDQHVHDAGCGHDAGGGVDPATQSALLASALSSPSRPLPGALRAEAEAFYRNDFSGARIHDDHVAQRATEALGAQAMTVGAHVFLGPGAAGDKEVMGHELGHVDKNLRGVRETGDDNGAGLSVTDPGQDSERAAAADGAAFAAGAATAPSAAAAAAERHEAEPAGAERHEAEPAGAVQRSAGAVQRSAGGAAIARVRSLQAAAGNHAVARLLRPGAAPVQRAGKGDKKTPKQTAKEIDEAVKEKWTKVYGGGRHGNGPDEVRRRYARSMQDDETSQTLSHQAFLVYDAVAGVQEAEGSRDTREREVQGMLINNRLFFASNFNESMQALKRFETKGGRDGYAALVSTHQSPAGRAQGLPGPDAYEYADRMKRADDKTQAVMAGVRHPSGSDATAEALRKRYGKRVALVDISDPKLHTLLTDEKYEGAIFLLTVKEEKGLLHAEQKLLLALHRSGISPKEVHGEHAIMGRYRGCLCCTAALEYYRSKAGFKKLDFDPNPGFYYWESLENLYRHQAHVVSDPDFKTYMLDLASRMPATPALSRMNPPEDASYDNGPESVVPAGLAARRNYRTPSLSDVEMGTDEDGRTVYSSYTRTQDVADTEPGHAPVGHGSEHVKSRMSGKDIITDPADQQRIQETWLGEDQDRRRQLLKYWVEKKGAGYPELARIVKKVDSEPSMEALRTRVYRIVKDKTGHKEQDNKREAGEAVVRRPDKGKYAAKKPDSGKKPSKPKRMTMTTSSPGWGTIMSVMQTDQAFYHTWQQLGKGKQTAHIAPKSMPAALAQTVAALSNEYTVSSMAQLLHMAERSLTRHVNRVEAAHVPDGQASGPVDDEDVPMSGTGGDEAASYSYSLTPAAAGASYSYSLTPAATSASHSYSMTPAATSASHSYSMTPAAGGSASTYRIADVGTSTGTVQHPEIPGYVRRTDRIGQVTYLDPQTGSVSIWDADTRRLVVVGYEPVGYGADMDWSQ
jgi:hypothetical protein